MDGHRPILFYDGACGLCDWSVRWCLKHDRRGVLRYAPLQGETYAALPVHDKPLALDTLVLFDQAGLHTHSAAVIGVLRHVGGGWRALASIARLIPRPIRDGAYRAVARRRLKWFGGPEACLLPEVGRRDRMLR